MTDTRELALRLALDVGLLVQREDVLWVQAMPGTEHIERLVRLAMAEGLRMGAEMCADAVQHVSCEYIIGAERREAGINTCTNLAARLRVKAEELSK